VPVLAQLSGELEYEYPYSDDYYDELADDDFEGMVNNVEQRAVGMMMMPLTRYSVYLVSDQGYYIDHWLLQNHRHFINIL